MNLHLLRSPNKPQNLPTPLYNPTLPLINPFSLPLNLYIHINLRIDINLYSSRLHDSWITIFPNNIKLPINYPFEDEGVVAVGDLLEGRWQMESEVLFVVEVRVYWEV